MKKMNVKDRILSYFGKNANIESNELKVSGKTAYIFYISCLIDNDVLISGVLSPLKSAEGQGSLSAKKIKEEILASLKVKEIESQEEVQTEIFNGALVLALEGEEKFLAIPAAGPSLRSIAEPPSESVLRGPREGFIEDIETNLSMLRRRLKDPSLAVKETEIGKRTKTKVKLVYLEDIVNPKVVKELEKRLKKINIDAIIDSFYIEELLTESGEKFFKRFGSTEKPDVVAAKVLEGRVAILVDGSPVVLTAPFVYFEDMQSPGDYYEIPARGTVVRLLRLVGLLLAIMLPGVYVALQSYQYRALPINFLISLLNSIEGLSFPPILEILFVLFLFEILAEASIRMPKQLGMALSIIGALILGDTAVQAGIITPPSIVVVAISGITLYIIPNESSELSILRTIFTIVGGIAGFYGIYVGFFILTTYLISLESYGAPYFAPFAPHVATDLKDSFIKRPLKSMIYRPKSFKTLDSIRQLPFDGDLGDNMKRKRTKGGKKK